MWHAKVTQAVERDGFHAVRITRLNQSLLSPLVRVDTHFLAMEKPGVWFEVAKFTAEVDANTVLAERTDLIKSDPQVKQVLETLTTLGIPIDQARIDRDQPPRLSRNAVPLHRRDEELHLGRDPVR